MTREKWGQIALLWAVFSFGMLWGCCLMIFSHWLRGPVLSTDLPGWAAQGDWTVFVNEDNTLGVALSNDHSWSFHGTPVTRETLRKWDKERTMQSEDRTSYALPVGNITIEGEITGASPYGPVEISRDAKGNIVSISGTIPPTRPMTQEEKRAAGLPENVNVAIAIQP